MFSIAPLGIAGGDRRRGGLAIIGAGVKPDVVTWGNIIVSGQGELLSECIAHRWPVARHLLHGAVAQLPRRRRPGEVRRPGEARECSPSPQDTLIDASERFPAAPLDGALLAVEDVKIHFQTDRGLVRAVDGVSFSLERGKTIGIVGESGSGKTVLSRSVMGLLPKRGLIRSGSIRFEGTELIDASNDELRQLWGTQMAMVFQDPMTSLNPVMKIGTQITESLLHHLDITKDYAKETGIRCWLRRHP
jgi:ATPase subunit of ABC transporter with duplicated ATPase domains